MKEILLFILAFALIFCLAACSKKQAAKNPPADNPQEEISIEHIWGLTDENDFIIAMTEYLTKKAQYGDDISALSEAERVFYVTQLLEMEVNNGGFSQFFYNSGGNFSHELVSAFTSIGANATAAICQKAIDAFGRDIPADRDERIELLDELTSDTFDATLEQCDEAFFAYEDDLNQLNYRFVMANREQNTSRILF